MANAGCDDKERGTYKKFCKVIRMDGRSDPGEKHYECDYWIMDLNHDPFTLAGLKAYHAACASHLSETG